MLSPVAKIEAAAAKLDLLIALADEMHLDAALARIVDRLVAEGALDRTCFRIRD